MIIAIDGYEANVEKRVGIGRYAYEILRHLHKQDLTGIQFRIFLPNPPRPDMPKQTLGWDYIVAKPKTLWTFFGLPKAILRSKPPPDLIFSPTHYIPRFITTIPRVMAIMDMSFLEYPHMFTKSDLHKLVNWTSYAARRAAKIITISQYSRNAIMRAYGLSEENVVVTYPGLSMGNGKVRSAVSVLGTYNIAKNFILSVGTIQPRKNYTALIHAFSIVHARFPDTDLVIVGKKGWLYEEIFAAPQQYGVSGHVHFLTSVTDAQLRDLYGAASCFALVSLYEGFGFPVLEAMQAGCPVVASNVSSLPEVAGDAAILIDPHSVDSIALGLTTALSEKGTQKERERIQKGFAQVKKFSWEKAARQTLAVLQNVAKEHTS